MEGCCTTSYAVLDVETTIFQKGNPYADRNRLCYVGVRIGGVNHTFTIDVGGRPYSGAISEILALLADVERVVVFNGKFDLAWCHRYGIDLSDREIWDVQLGEFLLNHQSTPYPSLDQALLKYGLEPKDPTIENEYWSVGIDTDAIPPDKILSYLGGDLEKTDAIYRLQLESLSSSLRVLHRLQCQDLLVLLEMERNGILFNFEAMRREESTLTQDLSRMDGTVRDFAGGWPHFNPDSGDHLSQLLYGGTISVDVAEPYEHTYKSGPKAGTTETRNRWVVESKSYPRLVQPLQGSELKKPGFYSTEESTLLKLRPRARELIDALLNRSKVEKLLSTYLVGIPAHLEKYDWQDGLIHGTINQCVAITGRLSATKPNQQNFPPEVTKFITSRF